MASDIANSTSDENRHGRFLSKHNLSSATNFAHAKLAIRIKSTVSNGTIQPGSRSYRPWVPEIMKEPKP